MIESANTEVNGFSSTKLPVDRDLIKSQRLLNMIEVVEENVNMIEDTDPNGYDLNVSSLIHGEQSILVLRGPHPNVSSQGPLILKDPIQVNQENPSKCPPKISMLLREVKVPLLSKDLVQKNQVSQNNYNPRMLLQN